MIAIASSRATTKRDDPFPGRGEAREEAIPGATLELLAEVGYDRMSMDAFAVRARVSKATIYRHWSGQGRTGRDQVGLDHVAFGCASRDELEKWSRRLDELGIEHGGIKDAAYGSGLAVRDPDGIAPGVLRPASDGLSRPVGSTG